MDSFRDFVFESRSESFSKVQNNPKFYKALKKPGMVGIGTVGDAISIDKGKASGWESGYPVLFAFGVIQPNSKPIKGESGNLASGYLYLYCPMNDKYYTLGGSEATNYDTESSRRAWTELQKLALSLYKRKKIERPVKNIDSVDWMFGLHKSYESDPEWKQLIAKNGAKVKEFLSACGQI